MRPHKFITRPWGVVPSRPKRTPSERWRIRRIQWWIFVNCWFTYPPNEGTPKLHGTWAEALAYVNEQLKGKS